MRRVVKLVLAIVAVFIGLATALLAYSFHQDQKNFSAATNPCERGCIRDSGGIDQCRAVCVGHPDHYP
jgi:hypothetical protein